MSTKLRVSNVPTVDHESNWDEFKQWLNGTVGKLPHTWVDEGQAYSVCVIDGTVAHIVSINKDGGAPQIEFEATYKVLRLNQLRDSNGFFVSSTANIVKTNAFAISFHAETQITALNYTVTSGKTFYLAFFGGTAFSPQPSIFRLKVAGSTVLMRMSSVQGDGNFVPTLPILLATSGQQITVTIDPQNPNGNGWAGFMGFEV